MTTATDRIPLNRNPYWTWFFSGGFTDIDGRFRATWQLLNHEGRAKYTVRFSDGIPQEELAPEWFTHHTRVSLRDEVTRHERNRIGAP
jgi:hypothetical protein